MLDPNYNGLLYIKFVREFVTNYKYLMLNLYNVSPSLPFQWECICQ